MFEEFAHILDEELLYEAIDKSKVERAMDKQKRVVLRYVGEDGIPTTRQVEIFAYGLSKAGNEVIRAFQLSHRNTSHPTKSGEWKMFRLDRITDIKLTPYDVSFLYPYIRKQMLNKTGDKSMPQVFRVLKQNYVPDVERGSEVPKQDVTPKYSDTIHQNVGSIGNYTTKDGEVLNIIGIKQRGNRIIGMTDRGGHLYMNKDRFVPGDTQQQNITEPTPDDNEWKSQFNKDVDDQFKNDVAKEANDDLDNITKPSEEGPIENSDSNDEEEYIKQNVKQ